jgi:hypothetical protein
MMHYTELCRVMGFLEGDDLERLQQLEEDAVYQIDEERMVDAANVGIQKNYWWIACSLY